MKIFRTVIEKTMVALMIGIANGMMILGSIICIMTLGSIMEMKLILQIFLVQVYKHQLTNIRSNSISYLRKYDSGKRTMHNKIQGTCGDHDTISKNASNSWW